MGISIIFKNKISWIFFAVLVFVLQTISGEAITRKADEFGVFEYTWIGEGFVMLLTIIQSKLFIALVSVTFGLILGRLSLKQWPEGKYKNLKNDAAKVGNPTSNQYLPVTQKEEGKPEQLEGWLISDRNDFDIIPHSFLVRCKRIDSGFDCYAVLFYKNRSLLPLQIKPLDAVWNIDGKTPDGKMSHGITTPIAKDKSDSIRFSVIRLYGENEKRGQASFVFKFGPELRCALSITYDFTIRAYPENKSTDMVVSDDVKLKAIYYAAPPEK